MRISIRCFVRQAKRPLSGFSVMGGSEGLSHTEAGRESARRKINEADQTIVICGEHSDTSASIHAEILLTIEAEKPYVLLWGRRDAMCTKPMGAPPAKGMYSWTEQVLKDQIAFNLRQTRKDAQAGSLRKVTRPDGRPAQPRPNTKRDRSRSF